MGKTAIRFRFLDVHCIGEHESWFSDMAAKGLHLTELGRLFAWFERGEPEQIRYRVDMVHGSITEEQRELYADSGWETVCQQGDMCVFRSPEHANAPEIHTDPAEQAYTLKELTRRSTASAVITTLLMAAAIVLMSFAFFWSNGTLLKLVEGDMPTAPILILLYLYQIFRSVSAARSLRRLVGSLREGRELHHRANWKRRVRPQKAAMLVVGLLTPMLIFLPFVQFMMSSNTSLPSDSGDPVFLRLSEIENDPRLERKTSFIMDGVDWGNFAARKWSLYAPLILSTGEHGVVPGREWADGISGEYSPSLSTSFYRLRFPWMGKALAKELASKQQEMNDIYGPMTEMRDTRVFDRLYVRDSSMNEIVACRDGVVVYVRYSGDQDMVTCLLAVRDWLERIH